MKRRRAFLLSLTVVLALCAAGGWWLHRERQQYARNRALIAAMVHNDTKMALSLVNEGADPNTRYAPNPAPSLKLLLNQLLHHPPPSNDSPTAFLLTCGLDWPPTVLLRHNFKYHVIKPSNQVKLIENPPLLQAMLAHGAQVKAKFEDNYTALHWAIVAGRLQTVELLLAHGVDVNAQSSTGKTPLMVAVSIDRVDIAHLLLEHGANPNMQDENGNTALHDAVSSLNPESTIPELMAHQANSNLKNQWEQTPLMRAQENNRSDIVRLLKQHSAK